jgi:LytR cell envelope-related transcriptional attenuator
VDHPLTAPESPIVQWRTVAYVATAIAVFELVVLLVIGGTSLVTTVSNRVEKAAVKRALETPAPAKQTKATIRPPAKVAAKLPRTKVRVLVLNGNGRQGAAAVAAARVQQRGYRIGGVANASRSNFARSIVMYRPSFIGEGRRLARDLGVKQVTPLDGMRLSQLNGAHVVFILGA